MATRRLSRCPTQAAPAGTGGPYCRSKDSSGLTRFASPSLIVGGVRVLPGPWRTDMSPFGDDGTATRSGVAMLYSAGVDYEATTVGA
eukprot:11523683-Alexandrium_andersonii.AAC.1